MLACLLALLFLHSLLGVKMPRTRRLADRRTPPWARDRVAAAAAAKAANANCEYIVHIEKNEEGERVVVFVGEGGRDGMFTVLLFPSMHNNCTTPRR